MIYVAHPYSNKEENRQEVERIIRGFIEKNPGIPYVSPIHTFGFMYDEVDYETGISWCLSLLSSCEAIVLCGDFKSSKGCMIERDWANENWIQCFTQEEWEEELCKF